MQRLQDIFSKKSLYSAPKTIVSRQKSSFIVQSSIPQADVDRRNRVEHLCSIAVVLEY